MPATESFGFVPDARQAQALDRRMRLSLADSLQHIAQQSTGLLEFDFAVIDRLVAAMRRGDRYPCSTFALYTEIVLAIAADDHEQALRLLQRIVQEQPLAHGWRVLALDDAAHAPNIDRYRRLMNSGPGNDLYLGPPAATDARHFAGRVHAAHGLMAAATPALAAEFDALVSDVILVAGDDKAASQFDGGSCYMMWGGLFLNVASHESDIALVEVLAHESAHILLYGCAADEALVKNADDELYPSPLRRDPRPMDGIYHATFVSARMHWAMSELIASGRLDEAGLAAARTACDEDAENFRSGYEVVARHGRLTTTGRRVMDAARAYMDSARSGLGSSA